MSFERGETVVRVSDVMAASLQLAEFVKDSDHEKEVMLSALLMTYLGLVMDRGIHRLSTKAMAKLVQELAEHAMRITQPYMVE